VVGANFCWWPIICYRAHTLHKSTLRLSPVGYASPATSPKCSRNSHGRGCSSLCMPCYKMQSPELCRTSLGCLSLCHKPTKPWPTNEPTHLAPPHALSPSPRLLRPPRPKQCHGSSLSRWCSPLWARFSWWRRRSGRPAADPVSALERRSSGTT
jgi:hypothetical protein